MSLSDPQHITTWLRSLHPCWRIDELVVDENNYVTAFALTVLRKTYWDSWGHWAVGYDWDLASQSRTGPSMLATIELEMKRKAREYEAPPLESATAGW